MGERAGRWLRVSTTGQEEKNQVRDIDRHVKARGYATGPTYELHGKSASKGEQESALEQVIGDIRAGKLTVLVCWSLDRLDRRGIAASFGVRQRIEEAGGRVEFALEPSMDELTFAVKSWMAQQESKRKAERSAEGMAMARSAGAATSRAPWGFTVKGAKRAKAFVPTPVGRREGLPVFERVADGESVTAIARELDARRAGGRRWYASTVSAMIRNSTYAGLTTDSAGNVVHRHEGIVDFATWRRANDALSDPGKKRRGPGAARHMLSGVLRCGQCGGPCYRTPDGPNRSTRYFRCWGKPSCHMVPTGAVNGAVDEVMSRTLGWVPVTRPVLVPGTNWDAEIQACKFELRGLDPDAEDYDERHAALRAALAELKARPSVPDRWEETGTGRTMRDVWREMTGAERARLLKDQRFSVRLWRDRIRVEQAGGEHLAAEVSLEATR